VPPLHKLFCVLISHGVRRKDYKAYSRIMLDIIVKEMQWGESCIIRILSMYPAQPVVDKWHGAMRVALR
jgi:hypothetical protein